MVQTAGVSLPSRLVLIRGTLKLLEARHLQYGAHVRWTHSTLKEDLKHHRVVILSMVQKSQTTTTTTWDGAKTLVNLRRNYHYLFPQLVEFSRPDFWLPSTSNSRGVQGLNPNPPPTSQLRYVGLYNHEWVNDQTWGQKSGSPNGCKWLFFTPKLLQITWISIGVCTDLS